MPGRTIRLRGELLQSADKIFSRYTNEGLKYGWKANPEVSLDFGHWNKMLLRNSKYFPYDHRKMPYITKHKEVADLFGVVCNMVGDRSLLRAYINGYTYGTDAYAHIDDGWVNKRYGDDALSETAVIYLNKEWDINWAGETVIFTEDQEDIEYSILPKHGRMLVFDSKRLHAARPVSRACPDLRTVLVLKSLDPKYDSPEVEFLVNQTSDMKHLNKTFFEHLYNTMLLLENAKASPEVALAGMYHSIYGSEFYKHDLKFSRQRIRSIIGDKAEDLAWEFSNLEDRFNSLIVNKRGYDEETLRSLRLIEKANLIDHIEAMGDKFNSQIEMLDSLLR